MNDKPRLILCTTIPLSLIFYRGQIGKLKEKFDVEVCSSHGDKLYEIAQEESVIAHEIEMLRDVHIRTDIKSLRRFIQLFRSRKPQVVHASTPKAGLLATLAAWVTRVPTRIYYLHGLRYDGLTGAKKSIVRLLEKVACSLATEVYAVSYGIKDRLDTDGLTRKEVKVINHGSANGINLSHFDPAIAPEVSYPPLTEYKDSNGFVFGFVGRLVKDKGINELVVSFLEINKKYPSSQLLLVGEYEDTLDPIRLDIKKTIETNARIHCVGFQSDIRPWLNLMDAFVFPSYREGFGVSVMEALAMSIPVISSDITGCNEIIQEEKNGLLIPPQNEALLLEAMGKLIDDGNLYQNLKKNSRESIASRYEQKTLWDATLSSYYSAYEKSI